jgi:ribonuclease HI
MNLKIGLTQQTQLKLLKGKKTRNTQSSCKQTGSKSEHRVGTGVAIFAGNELAAQLKFKLDKKCSNNRAEQLATVKALEEIETLDITENGPHTAAQSQ